MTASLLRGVDHRTYHADGLAGAPHFSRSTALTILQRSARHAWHEHPALGGSRSEDYTDASDVGSLVHSLLLGSGPEVVPVRIHGNKNRIGPLIDAENYRTAEAQEVRDAARAAGSIPVLPREWESIQAAAVVLREALREEGIHLDASYAEREATVVWDEEGGITITCKGRYDFASLAAVDRGLIVDLKVTTQPPAAFLRGVARYGLDIQAYTYPRALQMANPDLAEVEFLFALCEPTPPYCVALIPAGPSLRRMGQIRWQRALAVWRQCLAANDWPGYGKMQPAEAPPAALEAATLADLSTNEKLDAIFGAEEADEEEETP